MTQLLPQTPSQWARACEREAKACGYRLVFTWENGTLTASFYNAEFHLYDREFNDE